MLVGACAHRMGTRALVVVVICTLRTEWFVPEGVIVFAKVWAAIVFVVSKGKRMDGSEATPREVGLEGRFSRGGMFLVGGVGWGEVGRVGRVAWVGWGGSGRGRAE